MMEKREFRWTHNYRSRIEAIYIQHVLAHSKIVYWSFGRAKWEIDSQNLRHTHRM